MTVFFYNILMQKLLFALFLSNFVLFSGWTDTLLIVASKQTPYTRDIISGITLGLSESSPNTNTETIYIEDTDPAAQAQKQSYTAICTIGNNAYRAASSIAGTPIIFTLLTEHYSNSLKTRGADNTTGVMLSAKPEQQVAILKNIFPEIKTVYALYSDESEDLYREFTNNKLGVTFKMQKVANPQDIPAAMETMAITNKDVFFILPDASIYNRDSLSYVINRAADQRIAIVGFSSVIARAGAVMGYVFDYKDIGRQTSEIITKILEGASPRSIPPQPIRKLGYAINLKAAQDLGLEIPPETIKKASEIVS